METIRSIQHIAAAEAGNRDGFRTPGGAELNRRVGDMHLAATHAIIGAQMNGLRPSTDQATQYRLAAAIDRQITTRSTERQSWQDVTLAIKNDFHMQEAAASMLRADGHKDPLAHLEDPKSTGRSQSEAQEILARHNISVGKALRTASKHDITEIAGGRFDKIQSEHTRFAVGTVLGLNDAQMRTPTARFPEAREADAARRPFPSMGLAKGPTAHPASFGRKMVSAER